MTAQPGISVFFHNYYGDHEHWVRFFAEKINVPFVLLYNIVGDSIYNEKEDDRLLYRLQQAGANSHLQKVVLRRSPNLGKDIGGKLVLLDAFLRQKLDAEYAVFLHDKKSPYKARSVEWKEKLFRIMEPEFIRRALLAFDADARIGVIAGADVIQNEYDPALGSFASKNRSQLEQLVKEFGFPADLRDFRYIAGTMFWMRIKPLIDFFSKYPPLDIRKSLEKGNVIDETNGTNTHAWERMLSWLFLFQGYTIKGL